jgi:hypothetical protein
MISGVKLESESGSADVEKDQQKRDGVKGD